MARKKKPKFNWFRCPVCSHKEGIRSDIPLPRGRKCYACEQPMIEEGER
jgi:hypothetical protein